MPFASLRAAADAWGITLIATAGGHVDGIAECHKIALENLTAAAHAAAVPPSPPLPPAAPAEAFTYAGAPPQPVELLSWARLSIPVYAVAAALALWLAWSLFRLVRWFARGRCITRPAASPPVQPAVSVVRGLSPRAHYTPGSGGFSFSDVVEGTTPRKAAPPLPPPPRVLRWVARALLAAPWLLTLCVLSAVVAPVAYELITAGVLPEFALDLASFRVTEGTYTDRLDALELVVIARLDTTLLPAIAVGGGAATPTGCAGARGEACLDGWRGCTWWRPTCSLWWRRRRDDWLAADARTLTSCWAGLRGGTFGDPGRRSARVRTLRRSERRNRAWLCCTMEGRGGMCCREEAGARRRARSLPRMGFEFGARGTWQEWDGCEWLAGPTNTPGLLQCEDGSSCNVHAGGEHKNWACCGEIARARCPPEYPIMCAATYLLYDGGTHVCGAGHNCCQQSCDAHGGVRPCYAPPPPPPPPPQRRRLQDPPPGQMRNLEVLFSATDGLTEGGVSGKSSRPPPLSDCRGGGGDHRY